MAAPIFPKHEPLPASATASWRWSGVNLSFAQVSALIELSEKHNLQCRTRRQPSGMYLVKVKFGGTPSMAHSTHRAFQAAVAELMPDLSGDESR